MRYRNGAISSATAVTRCTMKPYRKQPRNGAPVMMMTRRVFSTALLAGAAASLLSTPGPAAAATPPKARNVVLVHGLFADGSCWTEVIARLQAAGLKDRKSVV